MASSRFSTSNGNVSCKPRIVSIPMLRFYGGSKVRTVPQRSNTDGIQTECKYGMSEHPRRRLVRDQDRSDVSPLRFFQRWGPLRKLKAIRIRHVSVFRVKTPKFLGRHMPHCSKSAIEVRQIGKAGVCGD